MCNNCDVTSSTSNFVLQKTIPKKSGSTSIILHRASSLSLYCTLKYNCSVCVGVCCSFFTDITSYSHIYFLATFNISLGIVAENNIVFFVLFVCSKISLISSINHIFNISSASSNIRYLILSNTILFLFK